MKARNKSPKTSTGASPRRTTLEDDSVVKTLRLKGLPVNRQNYLREAGFQDPPYGEEESLMPPELQSPEPPQKRSPREGYRNAASALTLIPEEELLKPPSNEQIRITSSGQRLR